MGAIGHNGGPAFPIETTATPYAPGMSLRDYFAGQAMAGMLADTNFSCVIPVLATTAYALADAMLAARDANGGGC